MFKKRLILTPLLLLLSFCLQAELQIRDAWIKSLPPSVPMRAGYMQLDNPGSEAVAIDSITSPAFASIEIHETLEKSGMMSMEPVEELVIEARSSQKLEPGGMHLMMMMPQQDLSPGDQVDISITYEDGSSQTLKMQVRK